MSTSMSLSGQSFLGWQIEGAWIIAEAALDHLVNTIGTAADKFKFIRHLRALLSNACASGDEVVRCLRSILKGCLPKRITGLELMLGQNGEVSIGSTMRVGQAHLREDLADLSSFMLQKIPQVEVV